MNRRRIGVLGAGWGTRVSVPAFRGEGWDVVGLWSRTPERAQAEATRLDIPSFTTDAEAFICRPDIDAVAIHTPPGMHLALCRMAFAAGKHVLCDKPIAMDAGSAREMLRAADASDVVAMVNFEFRFEPVRLFVRDMIERGEIGLFRHAAIQLDATNPFMAMGRRWRLDPAQGGGLLNELGSHYLDLLHHWFGDLSSVSAQLKSFPPPGLEADAMSEDWLSAACTFVGGGAAQVTMSWVANPPPGSRIVIVGSDGVLTIRSAGSTFDGADIGFGRSEDGDLATLALPAQQDGYGEGALGASRRLIAAFGRGIDEGHSPSPDFRDGLRSQIAIDAVRASSAGGRVVEIGPASSGNVSLSQGQPGHRGSGRER